MDLIGALAGQLGIDNTQAQAVAGAVLGSVRADAPDAETSKIDEAIPELGGWEATAKKMLASGGGDEGGGGMLGGLVSAAGSGLGNQLLGAVAGEDAAEKAAAVSLLGKLGLQPSHAALAAPVVLSFLEARLGESTVGTLLKAAPMLAGLKQAADDDGPAEGASGGALGAVTGALGGLFGKD